MRSKKSKRFTGTMSTRTRRAGIIGLGAVCVVAAAMLMAREPGNKPSVSPEITTVEARSMEPMPEPLPAPQTQTKETAATITGCLERDDETFRLKNTAGADAPKSRSWKSAFLKKGSASLEVIDPANRLKLSNHIGERVSVTGMLVDREIQVRSLRRIAGSCA